MKIDIYKIQISLLWKLKPYSITDNFLSRSKEIYIFYSFLNTIDTKFSILGLSETWFRHEHVNLFGVPGCSHQYNLRQHKFGGDVYLIIKSYIIRKYIKLSKHNKIKYKYEQKRNI